MVEETIHHASPPGSDEASPGHDGAPTGSGAAATSRRRFVRAAGASVSLGALAGCIDLGGGGGGNGGLSIGIVQPLSGPASNIGEQKRMAAELSRDLINDGGGVHGEDVELVFGDSESEPSAGRNEVNRLISQENVDAVGGGFHSDVALATVEVTSQNETPHVLDEPVSSDIVDKINEQELWNVFKTTPPSQAYAVGWRQLISRFQEDEVGYFPYEDQTIALIGEDTSYGLSIMDLMQEEMAEIGWEVVSQDEVGLDETDFTSLLARIEENDPDVVWAVQTSSSGAGNLARQFAETGFQGTHFFHNYGLTIADARETAGDAADGAMTLLNAGRVDPLLEEQGVLSAWDDEYDADMTGSAALSYQNVKIIAEYVRSFDGLDAFRSASVSDWEETVISHDPIPGGTGHIDFQENHAAAWGSTDTQPALGYQVLSGELNLVWPGEVATTEIDGSVY
ncbi:ABC transporter substrate-binding protein [Halorarum salinum]|uniref:ABC transporter substrate-binding protein n=1 Tax=Halorarum salinum TaxID=2743089 RepID=A0A7D5LC99_9EURY|nr:ABC transporter substrate-binding protein [Halobaculum salinum]QLG63413.1 ABC transporter substrate-binding protein [Halobaculum salinum]